MPKPHTFDEGVENFTNYKERLDAYLLANDITQDKHPAVLLSSIGPKPYNVLRSLTAPDLPSTKSYEQLCDILTSHYCPRPLEIMERFKFHKCNQGAGESVADFITRIKRLSEFCNFGQVLSITLRDRFVCGLNNESVQKRLLQEKDLTFERATSLALAMEMAQRDAQELQEKPDVHKFAQTNSTFKQNKTPRPAHKTPVPKPGKKFPQCLSCGKNNHTRSNCFYRDATCNACHKKGHISKVCKSNSNKGVHEIEEQNELFHLAKRSPKMMLEVNIDNVKAKMELDTGSSLSIMTLEDYRRLFHRDPDLRTTNVRLKTYTGELIQPLGYTDVQVQLQGQSCKCHLFILRKGSVPLFGRDWLHALKMNLSSVPLAKMDVYGENTNSKNSGMETKADHLVKEFASVFSEGIGTIINMTATLSVQDGSVPKFLKARQVPYALKDEIEKELNSLEGQGIISKVKTSEWATPIVPVMKKNGTVRICGDYKVTINPVLQAEQYTLPRVEDMLATLEQGNTFSKIDLRQAYLQLPLEDNSKLLTTINTHKGLYVYNRLVFGITSSPAIWQRTMDKILQGLPGVQCNQDDMIITGRTDEEHLTNLRNVLSRLQEYGLKANASKCSFFRKEVVFCGMKVTEAGVHKTEDKINAVKNAPIPSNKTELRSFLGMVNYYHKWLNNIAHIAKPLYSLLQEKNPFKWNSACDEAFSKIKEMVASDKVLIRYDPNLPVRLACDASPYGIGAVLSHVTSNGDERPIAYASRTLNKAEENYSQLDKEALAIVWAVKKFFHYLCGRKFTLITDHQPLKFIFNPSKGIPAMSAARQQRYAIFLSGFNYDIEYRNSQAHANADGLSRLPLPSTASFADDEVADALFYSEVLETMPVSATDAARESRRDPLISEITNYVEHDNWPHKVSANLQPFSTRRHELSVQQGCLLWGHRLIVPAKLRKDILSSLHMGHLGVVKMKNVARNYFWWPGLDKEIEGITKSCVGCSMSQPDPVKAPLHPWQWPDRPWQRIHIDYAGPFLGSMFLIIVDAHSKWAEVFPTSSTTSASTIRMLSETFARFGVPDRVVSDNGPQFTSDEFKTFVKINGIMHTTSAPYHPSTNGLAERFVQSFKQAMKSAKHDKGTLHTKLARFLFAYRNAPHSTTNETPAVLMFGRKLRSHLNILRPSTSSAVAAAQQRQADTRPPTTRTSFNIGDKVLVRDYRGQQRWLHGTVYASTGPLSYQVEIAPGVRWHRHADQMVYTTLQAQDCPSAAQQVQFPPAVPSLPDPPTDSQRSDRDMDSTRSQVEPSSSPIEAESQNSPSLPNQQVESAQNHTNAPYTTRSGRKVRKPNKYTD